MRCAVQPTACAVPSPSAADRGAQTCNGTLSVYDITQMLDDFFDDLNDVGSASITIQ